MSQDITAFGLRVIVFASVTFPSGLIISQFADDADPLDTPSIKVADVGMGLNGDLIGWSKATPVPVTLNVVPNSEDDLNLAVLLENNRVGKGKLSVRDVINMTVIYPDGRTASFLQGKITDGMPSNSAASSGRFKSKPYQFAFENTVRT